MSAFKKGKVKNLDIKTIWQFDIKELQNKHFKLEKDGYKATYKLRQMVRHGVPQAGYIFEDVNDPYNDPLVYHYESAYIMEVSHAKN